MSGFFTVNGAGKALDAATGRATQTARTMYIALLTTAPTNLTTPANMVEYAPATGYSRQAVAGGVPTTTSPATETMPPSGSATFGPVSGAGVGTPVVGWLLVSAATGTGGDATMGGTFDNPRTYAAGDNPTILANGLSVSLV